MSETLSGTVEEKAKSLENCLVSACEGNRDHAIAYKQLRFEFIENPTLRPLLPEFVRTCRDLDHFWGYIKDVSPQWAPRRHHVRDAFTPLFEHLEGKNSAPIDAVASGVLAAFDADGVQVVWFKALERRHTDPEGAITSARTLLETVCKRVLDEAKIEYDNSADLPSLYKQVAKKLRLAPSDHTEETFKRILGGATSVVEGLGTLRNKMATRTGRAESL